MIKLARLLTMVGIALLLASPAISAQTPVPDGAWQVTDARPLDLAAKGQLLSPDGSKIAGLSEEGLLCVWDVASEDQTCLAETYPVDLVSLAWSPDGSQLAFSLSTSSYEIASDIYVMDTASGDLTNLTDDDKDSLDDASAEVDIDTYPTWSPDGEEIVFIRSNFAEHRTWLATIPAAGGEVTDVEGTAIDLPLAMNSPIFWQESGALFYSVFVNTDDDELDAVSGIWRWENGEATQVMPGAKGTSYPGAQLTAVTPDDQIGFGYSPILNGTLDLSTDVSTNFAVGLGDETPLSGQVIPTDSALVEDMATQWVAYPPTLSPDGSAVVYGIADHETNTVRIMVSTAFGKTGPYVVYEADGIGLQLETVKRGLTWADNDTILIPSRTGNGTLLTLVPGVDDEAGEGTPTPVPAPCSCTPPAEDASPPA